MTGPAKVPTAEHVARRAERIFGENYPLGDVKTKHAQVVMRAVRESEHPEFPDPDAVREWVTRSPRRDVRQLSEANRNVLNEIQDALPEMSHLAAPKVAAIMLTLEDLDYAGFFRPD